MQAPLLSPNCSRRLGCGMGDSLFSRLYDTAQMRTQYPQWLLDLLTEAADTLGARDRALAEARRLVAEADTALGALLLECASERWPKTASQTTCLAYARKARAAIDAAMAKEKGNG